MEALISTFIVSLCTFFALIILNSTLAYAHHLMHGTFKWDEMLRFLKTKFAPYLLIWVVFSLVNIGIFWLVDSMGYNINIGSGFMTAVISAVSIALIARLWKRIWDKIKVLKIQITEKIKK